MALEVSRVDLWAGEVEDRPGALAEKLAALAAAGADLRFLLARRAPEAPGTGVVFLAGVKGPAQCRAARQAGFIRTAALKALRAAGPDRQGIGARITEELAVAGINLRGLTACVIAKRLVMYLALDTAGDAKKAARILRRM